MMKLITINIKDYFKLVYFKLNYKMFSTPNSITRRTTNSYNICHIS